MVNDDWGKPHDPKGVSPLKYQVYLTLEHPWHGGLLPRVLCVSLLVLICANAALVFVDPAGRSQQLGIFELVSALCFAVEYFCRLWVADLVRPNLTASRARLRYAFGGWGIIDFLAFAPTLLTVFVVLPFSVADAICVIRLIRIMKLSRYMRGLRTIGRVLSKRYREVIAAFAVLALLTLCASVLMYQAEHEAQPAAFDSMLTGLYWAMTTITSTGYGDLVPITAAGRCIGFAVMVLSIAVVAIPASIFAAGFVEEFQSEAHHPHGEDEGDGEGSGEDGEGPDAR